MGKGLSICQIAKSNAVALSFSPTFNVMWYNWRRIDGFQCPVKIVISRRGLGKTFGKVRSSIEDFVTDGARFIYVVETGDMVRALTQIMVSVSLPSSSNFTPSKTRLEKDIFIIKYVLQA